MLKEIEVLQVKQFGFEQAEEVFPLRLCQIKCLIDFWGPVLCHEFSDWSEGRSPERKAEKSCGRLADRGSIFLVFHDSGLHSGIHQELVSDHSSVGNGAICPFLIKLCEPEIERLEGCIFAGESAFFGDFPKTGIQRFNSICGIQVRVLVWLFLLFSVVIICAARETGDVQQQRQLMFMPQFPYYRCFLSCRTLSATKAFNFLGMHSPLLTVVLLPTYLLRPPAFASSAVRLCCFDLVAPCAAPPRPFFQINAFP